MRHTARDRYLSIVKLIAYANRYGHIGFYEVLSMELPFLELYSKALGAIVAEENKPAGA